MDGDEERAVVTEVVRLSVERHHRVEAQRRVLSDRIGVLAGQIHALEAELVAVLGDHDAVGGWQGDGLQSHAQWISRRTKFTPGDARRFATVVAQADRLPTLLDSARAGQVSIGLVAAAARVVTDSNETAVAQIVNCCTPAQALRVLCTYRAVAPTPDPSDPSDPAGSAGSSDSAGSGRPDVWWRQWTDRQGRHRIDAALDPVTGALLQQARQAARAATERATTQANDPTDQGVSGQGAADQGVSGEGADSRRRLSADEVTAALAATVLDSVNRAGTTDRGGERFAVQVTCDLVTLAHALGVTMDNRFPVGLGSRAYLAQTGQHLSDTQLARVVCDAELQLLVEHDGAPLWLGHNVRLFNRHQRRAMNHRSGGGCEFPGCTTRRWVEAHHIIQASNGGPTDLDNGVLLCSHHHHQLHRQRWTITRNGTQLTFYNGGQCLGSTGPPGPQPGPPPDDTRLEHVNQLPDPPPGITPKTTLSPGEPDRLTHYALDTLITTLLAA